MRKVLVESLYLSLFMVVMFLFAQACEPRGANRDTIEEDNSYEMMEGEDVPPAEEEVEEELDTAEISELRRLESEGMRYRKFLDSVSANNPEITYTYVPSKNGSIKTVLGDYKVEVDNTLMEEEEKSIAVLLEKRFENRQRMLDYYNKLNHVDMPPSPKGGYATFYQELQENLDYPAEVKNMKVEGLLFVQLAVEKDGTLSNIEISENINTKNDDLEEKIEQIAIAAIKETQPVWLPAQNDGEPVRSKLEIPVWLDSN